MKHRVALTAGLLVALTATPALAQSDATDSNKTEAIAAYRMGRALLAQKKTEAALEELQRSLRLLPSPNTELLIGHALRELGRLGEAMGTYQRVLADASAKVQAGEARYQRTLEEAGRWSAALRPKVGKLDISVAGCGEGCRLTVDEREIALDGRHATAWFATGPLHTAVATSADGREARREISVEAGGVRTEVILTVPPPEPEPAPQPVAPPAPTTPPDDDGGDFPLPPWPVYVAGGVGVVGFALFAGFGAASASTASDLDECAPNCPESLREDADAGKRNQTIANVGLGIGITGLVAAGTIWALDVFVFDEGDEGDETMALRVGPTGAILVGRF
jgi:hypothetical protein